MSKTDRQAVLFIHGIGNQQPMETLRKFVDAVWTSDEELKHGYAGGGFWSKPDHISGSYELRRLTTPTNEAGIRTDFFEFYWAHLMHGTRYGHVLSWARTLLVRRPSSVPPGLRSAYWLLWALLGAAAWLAIARPVSISLGGPVAVALLAAAGFVVKEVVGDAARYLQPAPSNIHRREEIRKAGIRVLRKLHGAKNEDDTPKYDRIIVVGHSLGSVVGYDVLSYAWAEMNDPEAPKADDEVALRALEALARGDEANVEAIQGAQRAYFEEFRSNGGEWRVTDFVTLGSPLAHSEVLLARDGADLEQKVGLRELPRCLPVLETKKHRDRPDERVFSFMPKRRKPNGMKMRVAHHAAVFGPTRWTNLYFPCRRIVWGDVIGGPISPILGAAIKNRPVATNHRVGFLSHTSYWRASDWSGDGPAIEAVAALRDALDLADQRSGVVAVAHTSESV